MPRIFSLLLQLSFLLAVAIAVKVIGVWSSDTIMILTAVIAVALSSITARQIVVTFRPKRYDTVVPVQERQESRSNRIGHTARFKNSIDEAQKEFRERERAERRRLNIEADRRRMRGEVD